MPSSSLRWRVTSVVVAVAALLVVSVGVVVDLVLEHQLEHQLNAQMSVHAQRATMLIRQGVPPDELVRQLHDRAVLAELRAPDGSPVPGGPGGPSPALTPPMQRVVVPLSNGTQLVLTTDVERLNDEQERLRLLLSTVGGVGLALAAMAMLVGVRAALRPLDTMAGLAEAITAGDRGRRLRPRDTRTELGRTAAAFDTMLDALETAQAETESARAQAEAARADAEAAAAQARDAEAAARRSEITLRRFLADAAHELRTPLAGMQTLAETLVRHPDLALEPREQVATTLVRETRRATRLVTEMLELARLEGGPPPELGPVSLQTLTTLANREVERTRLLAPGLTVRLLPEACATPTPKRSAASVAPSATGEPSEPSVLADPARLTQILANLLDNARRHTPCGGSITVSVTHTHTDALLTVRDTGPGVSEVDRERIFDRLVRLDEARTHDAGGAGLGLPIARALARAHQGDLVYLAEPGGAAFQLRLPLRPEARGAG